VTCTSLGMRSRFAIWAELELLVLFSRTTGTDPDAVAVPGRKGRILFYQMVRATNSSKTAFRLSTTSKRVTRSTDSAPFEPRKVNAKMDGAPSTSPDARRSAKADKNGLGSRPRPESFDCTVRLRGGAPEGEHANAREIHLSSLFEYLPAAVLRARRSASVKSIR
jgi:hypothetical protein